MVDTDINSCVGLLFLRLPQCNNCRIKSSCYREYNKHKPNTKKVYNYRQRQREKERLKIIIGCY